MTLALPSPSYIKPLPQSSCSIITVQIHEAQSRAFSIANSTYYCFQYPQYLTYFDDTDHKFVNLPFSTNGQLSSFLPLTLLLFPALTSTFNIFSVSHSFQCLFHKTLYFMVG